MDNFERDFLSELGFDPEDQAVRAAAEDAQTHARIIETLVHVRNDRTMTQADVADRMGTTQSRVSNFERIGGDPRLSTLLRYARAVDTKLRISATAAPRGWATVALNLPPTTVNPLGSYAPDTSWEKVSA
jgi:transcriptional regulator with XRE-family HTH domain